MKDLLNKTIEFTTLKQKERRVARVTEYNEPGTRLALEVEGKREELACGEVEVHRVYQEGEPIVAPRTEAEEQPERPPAVRWSPVTKTVQSFEDGVVDEEQTDYVRKALGLPVPWKRGMLAKEYGGEAVLLTAELEAEFKANGRFGGKAPENTEKG